MLNIFNIYKYLVSCFVFLHMQKFLPSPLSSLFVLNSDCHQYLTRQKDNLQIHSHKYSFSLRVHVPQFWNDIPLSLRNSLTLSSYKHKLSHCNLEAHCNSLTYAIQASGFGILLSSTCALCTYLSIKN